jgi:thioredoxin 1
MSDNEIKKIRQQKAEMLLRLSEIPKKIVNISKESDLIKLSSDFSDKIIIIDFWAVWCAPCKMFAPTFQKLQQEYYKDYIFAKVNVDENPKLAQYYNISSIPTVLLIKDGEVLRKFVGAMNYETMKQILERFRPEA